MEDIVALAATTDQGHTFYFMTWGRIQSAVDPSAVEAIVLAAAPSHKSPGTVTEVRLCDSLQEAAAAPWFYECFFSFCQKRIPFGLTTTLGEQVWTNACGTATRSPAWGPTSRRALGPGSVLYRRLSSCWEQTRSICRATVRWPLMAASSTM